MAKGWHGESNKHSLAARGIRTANKLPPSKIPPPIRPPPLPRPKVTEAYMDKELDGYVPTAMSERGKEWIKEIVKKYNYDKNQMQEVIMDALWYSDEDFARIHSKRAY